MNRTLLATLSAASLFSLVVACGDGSSANEFPSEGSSGTGAGTSGGKGGGLTSSSGGGVSPTSFDSCADSKAGGVMAAAHLTLAVDISGSMCEIGNDQNNRDCKSPSSKWGQAKTALAGFFGNPAAKDTFVSLIPWSGTQCNGFDKPIGKETALPDSSSSLSTALASQSPNGGTPTHGAINGAVRYAEQLKASLTDGGATPIVLVTDGMPTGCSDLNSSKAAAAAAFAAGHPVYVIGLGNQVSNLNELAVAGGTKTAFIVDASQPNNVASQLQAALETIRGNALGCSLQLPKAPDGKTLDYGKVNVTFKVGSQEQVIPYSADCSNSGGWRYNTTPGSGSAPSTIELCDNMCGTVKASQGGQITYVLGCASVGGPAK
ncbi:MAG: vWA domain-containing protein [Polyangiaceae bacterium]